MDVFILSILDMITCVVWCSFPRSMLTMKDNKKWLFAVMIIVNCVESVLSRNIIELYTSPLKTLVYLLQFLLFILICFKEPVKQKLLAFFLVVVTLTVTDMMSLICLSLLGIDQNDTLYGVTGSVITAVFCLVVSYMLLLGIRIIYNKLKFKEVTNKMWQFQIVILAQILFIFIICFSTYSGSDSLDSMIIKSPSWQIWMIIAFVVTVVADVCLYHILITNSQNYELKKELEITQKKSELELEYYEKLKRNIEETRKINHDFNNILAVIQNMKFSDNLKNNDTAQKLAEELKESLDRGKVRKYCENDLVNLIVINKSEDIINKNIDFSVNISIPADINIKNFDLCRIFTNLLDNAKEACEMSEDKAKSFIVVTAYINGGKLFISTENFCDAPPNKKKGKLFSTKQGHKGLGLEIVKEIAQNYSGECVCKYNDNVFTTIVSLELN